jgi:hypothetical protein
MCRILIPPSPGSNPGAPANDFKELYENRSVQEFIWHRFGTCGSREVSPVLNVTSIRKLSPDKYEADANVLRPWRSWSPTAIQSGIEGANFTGDQMDWRKLTCQRRVGLRLILRSSSRHFNVTRTASSFQRHSGDFKKAK